MWQWIWLLYRSCVPVPSWSRRPFSYCSTSSRTQAHCADQEAGVHALEDFSARPHGLFLIHVVTEAELQRRASLFFEGSGTRTRINQYGWETSVRFSSRGS